MLTSAAEACPRLPSLEFLRMFAVTAKLRYVKAAGERLGISAPAVSQGIAKLERDLGAELFQREARPLRLTRAGERLLEAVLPILAAAETLPLLTAPESASARRLRLGLGETASATLAPWLIARLAEKTGSLETASGLTQALTDQLRAEKLDVILTPDPLLEEPRWSRELLYEEDFLFAVSGNAELPQTAAEAAALALEAPFIGYSAGSSDEVEIERILRSMNAKPRRRLRVSSSYTLCGLIAQTGGWSILPPTNLWCARQFLPAIRFAPLPEGRRRVRRMWAVGDPMVCGDLLKLTAEAAREVFAAEMLPELGRASDGLAAFARLMG